MPIHVAITRRVRAGCETEFQQALLEFFQKSFGHLGVRGASLLTPPPGSDAHEYGILRTFADEKERDAFYQSAMFKAWDDKARTLTEGKPVYRQLTGLEAWFRSPNPPPRWKMAIATFFGVFPTVMFLSLTLGPEIKSCPFIANNVVFNACVVALLTWGVMPLITRLLHGWLHTQTKEKST
jgi:antibiotic biosynthesis monooxygenase (ABM) superfamily enzyme